MSEIAVEDPFSAYEMFSPEGNTACEALVATVEEVAKRAFWEKTPHDREALISLIRRGVTEIALTHREVWDTEPIAEIALQINVRVFRPLGVEPLDRFEI